MRTRGSPILLALVVILTVGACGEEKAKVPSVEGDSPLAARTQLEALGFEVKTRNLDQAQIWEDSSVTGQAPLAGDEIQPGSTVTIVVSPP